MKAPEFERLVLAHHAELFRFAYWQCRDRSVAEDLVQETFARAWLAREGLRNAASARSWLYRILRNEHARLYERKALPVDDIELDDLSIADEIDLERDYAVREQIALLSPKYREPLLMQALGGFSCAEIAAVLGIGEEAAMQRLSRARLALRRLWRDERRPAKKEKTT